MILRGSRRHVILSATVVTVLMALSLSGGLSQERTGEAGFAHDAGRVAMNLPANGSLGEARVNDLYRGIRWPGPDGVEFLGYGGLRLRFTLVGEGTYRFIEPDAFRAIETGFEKRELSEGCSGGKRYPHRERDDDGDGVVDEDVLDCVDNDGDGRVDEDFAAVGNEMIVTRAIHAATGLVLAQRSYAWAYGHVRDFIGFTSTLEYPALPDEQRPDILGLDAMVFVDFQIGEPEDLHRGENDRFFIVSGKETGHLEREQLEFIAVRDARFEDAISAVVIFGARGPRGEVLGGHCSVVDAAALRGAGWDAPPESEYEEIPVWGFEVAGHVPGEIPAAGRGRAARASAEVESVSRELEGDKAVAFRLETVPELKPGDAVVVEWALVFGSSEEVLLRNVRRAMETYRGMSDESGTIHRWIVPARKALRRAVEAKIAPVWDQDSKQPAAVIVLPEDLEIEELEWLRISAATGVKYEQIESKILVTLGQELLEQNRTIDIEGQLTDGTVITARLGREQIEAYIADEAFPPGSLPEESMQLYPNPFITTLTINLHVYDLPDQSSRSAGSGGDGGSSVKIYDVQGKLVRTILERDVMHPGDYSFTWNGLDEYGAEVAPGVYYCKLQIVGRSLTKRVILLR